MQNGINVLPLKNKSATATVVNSSTVIGIVGTAILTSLSTELIAIHSQNEGLLRFSSVEDALSVFENVHGTIREDLWDIKQQNILSPIIISLVEVQSSHFTASPTNFYDDVEIKSAVILAVSNLQYARTIYGQASKVRISIASYFSHDDAVYNALESFAIKTKTIAIRDLNLETVNEAIPALEALGSRRQLVFPFYRKDWSIYANETVSKPNSAVVAGHIAYWDATLGEFGFAFDHANRAIAGVTGVAVNLTYEEGGVCEVNTIIDAGGAVLLNDDGWKLYNFETPLDDERFNKLETIRFFDGLSENLQKTLKKYKHRPLTDVLDLAEADANAFIGKTILAGSAVGGKAFWSEQNTASEMAIGNVYMDYDAGNNVGMRTLTLQPLATNEYYTV